jgi:hypothetical protein
LAASKIGPWKFKVAASSRWELDWPRPSAISPESITHMATIAPRIHRVGTSRTITVPTVRQLTAVTTLAPSWLAQPVSCSAITAPTATVSSMNRARWRRTIVTAANAASGGVTIAASTIRSVAPAGTSANPTVPTTIKPGSTNAHAGERSCLSASSASRRGNATNAPCRSATATIAASSETLTR